MNISFITILVISGLIVLFAVVIAVVVLLIKKQDSKNPPVETRGEDNDTGGEDTREETITVQDDTADDSYSQEITVYYNTPNRNENMDPEEIQKFAGTVV